MICFGKKDAKPQPVAAEKLPDEAAPEKEPAALVIRPAEVLLRPGESVKFQVIAYDRHGRRIGPVDAACTFPLKLGTLDAQGRFTAGKRGGIGEVRAELGKLVGTARVRVVPDLPISEDFESYKDGDTIGWWVGVSKAKYTIETLDGSKVLKKLHDDKGPIFNRSLAYITPPIPAGYTVEADVMGVKEGRRRGDVGVINCPLRAGTLRRRQEAAGHFLDARAAVREEDRVPLGRRHLVPHEAQGRGRRQRRARSTPRSGPATRPNPRSGPSRPPIRSRTTKAPPGSMPTAPWRHCIWTTSRFTGRADSHRWTICMITVIRKSLHELHLCSSLAPAAGGFARLRRRLAHVGRHAAAQHDQHRGKEHPRHLGRHHGQEHQVGCPARLAVVRQPRGRRRQDLRRHQQPVRAAAQGQGRQGRRDVLPRGRRQVPLAERPRQARRRAA